MRLLMPIKNTLPAVPERIRMQEARFVYDELKEGVVILRL